MREDSRPFRPPRPDAKPVPAPQTGGQQPVVHSIREIVERATDRRQEGFEEARRKRQERRSRKLRPYSSTGRDTCMCGCMVSPPPFEPS